MNTMRQQAVMVGVHILLLDDQGTHHFIDSQDIGVEERRASLRNTISNELISLKKSFGSLVGTFFVLLTTACGGSDGGGIDDAVAIPDTDTIPTFQPLVGSGTAFPVMDIFAQDLNSDGAEEVIIVGRITQPATDSTWQNFNMQVFKFNGSSLENITSTSLPNAINVITGSEPEVLFKDFDGDSDVDMFVAASTDMYDADGADNIASNSDDQALRGDNIMFVNDGTGIFTENKLDTSAVWAHDAVAHDFTGDGTSDVMTTDYQGNMKIFYYDGSGHSGTNTWKILASSTFKSSSGVEVGDFVTDGQKEIVLVDDGQHNNKTTLHSYSVDLGSGIFTLTHLGTVVDEVGIYDHTFRALTHDFNNDGMDDVIVFSRQLTSSVGSYVQFLRGDGAGGLTDVTGTFLSGYIGNEGSTGYQPRLIDIDGDTDLDVFISGSDFNAGYDSTQVLVYDGSKYTSTYSSNFASNWNAKKNATSNANPAGLSQQIVNAAGNYYLVTIVLYNDKGTFKTAVYTTDIGASPSGLSGL